MILQLAPLDFLFPYIMSVYKYLFSRENGITLYAFTWDRSNDIAFNRSNYFRSIFNKTDIKLINYLFVYIFGTRVGESVRNYNSKYKILYCPRD